MPDGDRQLCCRNVCSGLPLCCEGDLGKLGGQPFAGTDALLVLPWAGRGSCVELSPLLPWGCGCLTSQACNKLQAERGGAVYNAVLVVEVVQ